MQVIPQPLLAGSASSTRSLSSPSRRAESAQPGGGGLGDDNSGFAVAHNDTTGQPGDRGRRPLTLPSTLARMRTVGCGLGDPSRSNPNWMTNAVPSAATTMSSI